MKTSKCPECGLPVDEAGHESTIQGLRRASMRGGRQPLVDVTPVWPFDCRRQLDAAIEALELQSRDQLPPAPLPTPALFPSREPALPSQLSAGGQQGVGIARAIVGEPKLLVADEPTGNLDPTLAEEIMQLFAELPERGTSVLVVSHDLALLKRMRKRVLILDHGRRVDDMSPQDLAE